MTVLCLQDVSGGQPVPVEGTALPLWGLEIDPDRAKDEFRAFNARDDGKVGKDNAWGIDILEALRDAASAYCRGAQTADGLLLIHCA